MSLVLIVVGNALVIVGVWFAVANKASEKAGGEGLKAFSVQGPSWLVLIVFGLASVGYGVVRWEDGQVSKPVPTDVTEPAPIDPIDQEELFPGGYTFGDNNQLDRLWRQCERSQWDACDQLYVQSDIGSDYEWFGASCGGLPFNPNPDTEWCDPTNEG
jgi:hypothetical protein